MAPKTETTVLTTSPTGAPPPPTGPKTFPQFAKFPLELQMMIWECVPTTRRCFVVDNRGLKATPLPELLPKHQVILSVCKLSRQFALQRSVPAYAVKRSPECWELSVRQTPWNLEAAPKIYIDPHNDLFDITKITVLWKTLELEESGAEIVGFDLECHLGPELSQLIQNVAVGTPEYRPPETVAFLGEPSGGLENFNDQSHCERYRSAYEREALPNLKTMIMVPAFDVCLYRPYPHFLTSSHVFERKLLRAARISDDLTFRGQATEAHIIMAYEGEEQITVVKKVGKGTYRMETMPVIRSLHGRPRTFDFGQ